MFEILTVKTIKFVISRSEAWINIIISLNQLFNKNNNREFYLRRRCVDSKKSIKDKRKIATLTILGSTFR